MIFINFLRYAYQWKNTTLQFVFKTFTYFDDEDSQKMHLLIYYFNT